MIKEHAMSPQPSDLVVFVHIFKNSGTSVAQQLKKSFPDGRFSRQNGGLIDGQGFAKRVAQVLENPELGCLAGHFRFSLVHKTLADLGRPKARYFSFVREPISRAVSIYNYSRGLPGARHHAVAASQDLDGFLLALLADMPAVLADHQSQFLSADGTARFEAARAAIEQHFAFVGLSENLELSNDLARAALGLSFDGSLRRNVSADSASVADISPGVLAKLRSRNQQDARLHDYVQSRLAVGTAV